MHMVRHLRGLPPATVLLAALFWVMVGVPVQAQQINLAEEGYIMPPKEVADVVLSSRGGRLLYTNISPDGKKFLVTKTDGMTTVERLGKPHVYLGEMAFDHIAHRSRNLWVNSDVGYDIFYHADNRTVPVKVPERARVSHAAWSPDGSMLAFFAHFEDATHIYLADTGTGSTRRLTNTPVLATLSTTFQWSKDGRRIQTVLLPDDGRRELPKNGVASSPKVRVARDGRNPSRTYRYLLETPEDMELLEHLATGQLALVDIHDGQVTKVGFPNMIRSVTTVPGEELFQVTVMKKPFSYYSPASSFGSTEGIWSQEGKMLLTLADRNLRGGGQTTTTVQDPTAPAQRGQRGGRGGQRGGQQPPTQPPDPTDPTDPPDPTDPTQPPTDPTDPDQPPQRGGRGGQPADPGGRRELTWRPDGAGRSFLQLEPAKPDSTEPRKDRVMLWLAPFGDNDVKVVYESPNRISGLRYSEDCKMLFMTETVNNQQRLIAVDLADPKTTYVISTSSGRGGGAGGGAGGGGDGGNEGLPLESQDPYAPDYKVFDKGYDDGNNFDYFYEQRGRGAQPGGRGGQPGDTGGGGAGTLMTRPGSTNVVRLSSSGDVYLTGSVRGGGAGASARPFIDKVNIKTGQRTRVFEGKADLPETIAAVDGNDFQRVFTTRQRSDVAPNTFMYDLASGNVTKLTDNVDHNPWFHKVQTRSFQVTRVDGFRFRGRVTLPPDAQGKLPAIFWIYPREYTDQAAYGTGRGGGAGGRGGGPTFASPAPRSMAIWTLMGYAVVEPDIPIVGPAGRMNDNYVADLRNSLWAVIDHLDKEGIIDRDRLAVGGHSYGGFSTANTLAHTPFFKAGIAGDGCYNRTLTPMSFQSERRHLWEARETYLEMSPMLWANQVNGALLMYHGAEDANVGTHPMNAEFMFMCLEGLGKPASLYMYPYEAHGPAGKETILDQWARWIGWLDKYVKNPRTQTEQR